MKTRIAIVAGAVGALSLLGGFAAQAHAATSVPTCIVVHGPNGLNLQVGYAPNGPGGCAQF